MSTEAGLFTSAVIPLAASQAVSAAQGTTPAVVNAANSVGSRGPATVITLSAPAQVALG